MIFNEKYTRILEIAAEQDEEFKDVLNQIIKQLNEDEKALIFSGKWFSTTHLIKNRGEPFLREIQFTHHGRNYPDDDGMCFDESILEIEDVNVGVEKDGYYVPKMIAVDGLGNYVTSLKKSYSLNLVNFTKEWVDSLETFDSVDDYNEQCDREGVANEILILDSLTYDENDETVGSKTYSICVVKILNYYYLEYQRTLDNVNNESEEDVEQYKMIPITKEELYAIADLDCKLEDNI